MGKLTVSCWCRSIGSCPDAQHCPECTSQRPVDYSRRAARPARSRSPTRDRIAAFAEGARCTVGPGITCSRRTSGGWRRCNRSLSHCNETQPAKERPLFPALESPPSTASGRPALASPNRHLVAEATEQLHDGDNRAHSLPELVDIVLLTICAVVSGADGSEAIEDFGLEKLDWLRRFAPFRNGVPSHDCIANVVSRVSPKGFQTCLLSWTRAVAQVTGGEVGPDDLDVDAGGDVVLLGGSQVEGECQYGGTIFFGPAAGCGTEVSDTDLPFQGLFALPECTAIPPQTPEPESIHTGPRSTEYFDTPLQPGDYGNVSFGASNRVAMEAGEYHFQSLKFGPNTDIQILGPITLHVMDELRFANGVRQELVAVEPNEIVYLLDGTLSADPLHKGGASTVLFGTFCGPASRIVIGDGSELTGAIIAKEAVLGAKVHFTADPAPVH